MGLADDALFSAGPGADRRPGSAATLSELHLSVPATQTVDLTGLFVEEEPLTDGQVVGLLEHVLGARALPAEGTDG